MQIKKVIASVLAFLLITTGTPGLTGGKAYAASGYTINTIAGMGELGYFGDGEPTVAAQLSGPLGVAVDSIGNHMADETGTTLGELPSPPEMLTLPFYKVKGGTHVISWARPADLGTGVKERYRLEFFDGSTWTEIYEGPDLSYSHAIPTDMNIEDAKYRVRVEIDHGNSDWLESEEVIVDNTEPDVTFQPKGNGIAATSHAVTVSVTDDLSGVGNSEYQWTSSAAFPTAGTWDRFETEEKLITPEGETGTLYLHVRTSDQAGNEVEISSGGYVTSGASRLSGSFAGGDGSLENPYLIETAEQLNDVREDVDAHYHLISDIDISGYSSGEGWEPIGSLGNEFNGSFDGQGYVITGLTINRSSADNQGLFGIVGSDGTIRNVGLEGVRILGRDQVGGLVGVNFGAVEESYATGTVSGDSYVGVLVGFNWGSIRKSYAVGTATGYYSVGGLTGIISNLDLVRDLYFSGQVSGQGAVGGLIGERIDSPYVPIENSYWNVSAYASRPPDNGIGIPVTEENMKQRVTYENWDFTDTWYLYNGETFPFLQWEDPLEMVDVRLDSTILNIGETAQIEVTAQHLRDSYNATLTAEYAVTGGEQFVEVNEEGQVTAIAPGEAEITVILHGLTATVDVVVGDQFAGGDGSLENPYLIETAEQLNAVREDVDAHYQLISDINISGYSLREGWEPIGSLGNEFNGSFDGQGYVITGLTINRSSADNQGLFGIVGSDGTIRNVGLEVERILGRDQVGGLVGVNYGAVEESYATGTVSGDKHVGVLVGLNWGSIGKSYAVGTASGDYSVGGLAGMIANLDLARDLYFSGQVFGQVAVGGLTGAIVFPSVLENSYWNLGTAGSTPPNNGIGTPVTEENMKQRVTYENWDFTDTWYLYNGETFPFLQWEDPLEMVDVRLDSPALNIGDTARIMVTAHHLRDSYHATLTAEYAVTEGEQIVEVNQEGQVTAKAPGEGEITVTLHGLKATVDVVVVVDQFAGGDGSLEKPYLIETAEQLNAVRKDLEAHYQLISDIDLSGYGSEGGWEPIGNDTAPFQGMFDGQDYVIKHLTINRNEQYQGLFGVVGHGGQISNVALEEVNIHVFDRGIGGLAGKNNGEINESYVKGTVTGADEVGGLVGRNNAGGEIHHSSAEGEVTASGFWSAAGGLVGHNAGEVHHSHSEGEVTANNAEGIAGGLVGYNYVRGEIHHSYSTSRVTANVYLGKAGGLVGYNYEGEIHHSYAGGEVTANNTEGVAGGLVGVNESSGRVNNSYWNISAYDTIPPDNGVGTPVTEDEMKQRGTFNDWDFTDVWYLYNGETFPFLQWEDPLEMVDVQIVSTTLNIGDAAQITVTAHHQQGSFDGTFSAEYAVTEGEDIVEVDLEGQVTARVPGEAVITVTLHGEVSTINMTVHPYTITSVEHPNPITVANGTTVEEIGLPNTIEVTVSPDDGKREISVEWADAEANNPYQATVPGAYTFTGTLVNLPEDVENPNGLTAVIHVTVLEKSPTGGGSGGSSSEGVLMLSSNADLGELRVWDKDKKLELSPSFAANTTSYTTRTEAEQVEIAAKPAHFAAKVMLNDKVIMDRAKVHLEEGDNKVVLIVQSEIGSKKEYTLTIRRETPNPSEQGIHLTDITGHWAESDIKSAVAKGIVRGYPEGVFKPNNPVTRAQFAIMLAGALKLEGEGSSLTFADNDQIGGWAKKAVAQVVQAGIVNGYVDGSFRPDVQITRAEMAVMIARAMQLPTVSGVSTGFADDTGIPHWARGAVETISGHGIVNGRGGNRFVPNDTATRSEATVMLLRMLEQQQKP